MAPGVFHIAGRTALVTGSSRGIGRALALGLVEAGCSVAVHGRDRGTLEERVAGLAGTAAAAGARVEAVAFDVTDAEAVEAGVAEVEAQLGPLDILVNNAGVQHRSPLLDFPDDAWRRVLETNLTSAFLVGRAVARGMVARGRGKVVNVASLQSELARAGTGPYAASKGGLKMLTRAMCAEWGPAGGPGNAVGPGGLKTGPTAGAGAAPPVAARGRGGPPA